MDNTAYQEEPRYEIINGAAVMMSPRPAINHNTVAGNIYRMFGNYLKGKRCRAFMDGVDVHLDEKNTIVPDAMIICNRDIIQSDGIYGTPDLIVEVLSPSTARHDKKTKKILYENHAVKEYWIVDASSKSIEVYILQNCKFELDNVYMVFPDWQWAKMTAEEKSAAALALKVSLYDDLVIDIKDVFENVD